MVTGFEFTWGWLWCPPLPNVGVSFCPLRTMFSWYFNIDSAGEGGNFYRPNTFGQDCSFPRSFNVKTWPRDSIPRKPSCSGIFEKDDLNRCPRFPKTFSSTLLICPWITGSSGPVGAPPLSPLQPHSRCFSVPLNKKRRKALGTRSSLSGGTWDWKG